MICPNCGVDKESTLASIKGLLKERDDFRKQVEQLEAESKRMKARLIELAAQMALRKGMPDPDSWPGWGPRVPQKLWRAARDECDRARDQCADWAYELRKITDARKGRLTPDPALEDKWNLTWPSLKTQQKRGCRKRLALGQWWAFCGETDMGQTAPALCTECGGEFKLDPVRQE